MSRKYPVRSSQLVTPYGVGAMIAEKGKSQIVAGLGSWFHDWREISAGAPHTENTVRSPRHFGHLFDESEFVIREPRLEARLRVSGFRRPPDYRELRPGMTPAPNFNLTIPVLRFPQWHFCPRCGLMQFLPLTEAGKVFCPACRDENLYMELAQMSFIALCERGHLQDFPYREWVHRAHRPGCAKDLHYIRTGSGTLAGQKIKCSCGAARSLLNIDKANFSDTHLSFYLAPPDGIFFCRGHRPWLGETSDGRCTAYLRGNPRNAGNVWFPQTVSAINLPQARREEASPLEEFLSRAEIVKLVAGFSAFGEKNVAGLLKIVYPIELKDYAEEQINQALGVAVSPGEFAVPEARANRSSPPEKSASEPSAGGADDYYPPEKCSPPPPAAFDPRGADGEVSEEDFRHPEYLILRENCDDETLLARRIDLSGSSSALSHYFERLVQIHRLRETRVFTGFSRIFSDNAPALNERKAMLRSAVDEDEDWLPATTVHGEGIYLELGHQRLTEWLKRNAENLRAHFAPLELVAQNKRNRNCRATGGADHSDAISTGQTRSNGSGDSGGGSGRQISGSSESFSPLLVLNGTLSPVFIMLHTLAHLLIRQLTFECGYSASALRERIYFSEKKNAPMAGVLIYTADGDSEGTLGGLVRLGTPENLEKIVKRALSAAERCSLDPFCTEVGTSSGQGPGNCNLAACHACALLPETCCEHFNRFLDRALLVNLAGTEKIQGFFEGF